MGTIEFKPNETTETMETVIFTDISFRSLQETKLSSIAALLQLVAAQHNLYRQHPAARTLLYGSRMAKAKEILTKSALWN